MFSPCCGARGPGSCQEVLPRGGSCKWSFPANELPGLLLSLPSPRGPRPAASRGSSRPRSWFWRPRAETPVAGGTEASWAPSPGGVGAKPLDPSVGPSGQPPHLAPQRCQCGGPRPLPGAAVLQCDMWQVKLQVSLLALKWGTSRAGPRVARKGTCLLLASGFRDPRAPSAVARSAAPLFSRSPSRAHPR